MTVDDRPNTLAIQLFSAPGVEAGLIGSITPVVPHLLCDVSFGITLRRLAEIETSILNCYFSSISDYRSPSFFATNYILQQQSKASNQRRTHGQRLRHCEKTPSSDVSQGRLYQRSY